MSYWNQSIYYFDTVSRGSLTDFLVIIEGALLSIGKNSVEAIAPFSSIGLPKASTTRPKKDAPTGTFAKSPVE